MTYPKIVKSQNPSHPKHQITHEVFRFYLAKGLILSGLIGIFSSCENQFSKSAQKEIDARVEAQIEADKLKALTQENETLKAENIALKKENDEMKFQLQKDQWVKEQAELQKKEGVQVAHKTPPTPAKPVSKASAQQPKSPASDTLPAAQEKEALKEAITGGSSFK